MNSLLILTGHSKGLGKAILDHFLKYEAFQIIAISRTRLEVSHPRVTQISLDLHDLSGLEDKLPQLFPKGEYEKVILINNAGWIGEIKKVGNLNPKGIQAALNLNLIAPMMLTNAFVKAYVETKSEKLICNISSGAALKPLPGWAEYCSSKAGLVMFSKVAAEELGKQGFRVYSLAPGIVDTEMQTEIRKADQAEFPALERFTNYKSQGQLSSTEEVARKVFYLLSNPDLFQEVVQDVRNFDLP